VAGVLAAAVEALGDARSLGAAIGPGVGPCCYPVDAALRDRFASLFGAATVLPPAVDLAAAAVVALRTAGVPRAAIACVGCCTACDARRFFSYRRDGPATGRHGGFVWAGG
jgi:copper oxidase (laccase) domain-containing protein